MSSSATAGKMDKKASQLAVAAFTGQQKNDADGIVRITLFVVESIKMFVALCLKGKSVYGKKNQFMKHLFPDESSGIFSITELYAGSPIDVKAVRIYLFLFSVFLVHLFVLFSFFC